MKFMRTSQADSKTIQGWINADPDHKGKTTPEFFQDHEKAECMLMCDVEGPLMCVKIERCLRLHIQFDVEGRFRTARAMKESFNFFIEKAKIAGYNQVIFESSCKPLIAFCTKHFGFVESDNELVRQL